MTNLRYLYVYLFKGRLWLHHSAVGKWLSSGINDSFVKKKKKKKKKKRKNGDDKATNQKRIGSI